MTQPKTSPLDLSQIAQELARRSHAGQVDKQGRDYYEHHLVPVAELLRPYGTYTYAAGLLHDILEDTAVTAEDLLAAGIPATVVDAVTSVTRSQDSYDDLIERARANHIGRLVKLADNWVNLTGLDTMEDEATRDRLRQKYETARARLEFR